MSSRNPEGAAIDTQDGRLVLSMDVIHEKDSIGGPPDSITDGPRLRLVLMSVHVFWVYQQS